MPNLGKFNFEPFSLGMKLPSTTYGDRAWFGLVAYIASYDLWAILSNKETLSMSFYNSLKHPIRRWPTIAVWSYITAHLFKLIPDKYDPLRMMGAT